MRNGLVSAQPESERAASVRIQGRFYGAGAYDPAAGGAARLCIAAGPADIVVVVERPFAAGDIDIADAAVAACLPDLGHEGIRSADKIVLCVGSDSKS